MTIVIEHINKLMGWCPNARMKNIAVDNGMEYANISGTRGGRIFTSESTVYEENAPFGSVTQWIKVIKGIKLFNNNHIHLFTLANTLHVLRYYHKSISFRDRA